MPRKAKQLKKDYTGDLKKPIRLKKIPEPPCGGLKAVLTDVFDGEFENYRKECGVYDSNTKNYLFWERVRKLGLLFDHYNIDKQDPDRWFHLSFYLADNHVPGFKVEEDNVGGAPVIWDDLRLALLYFQVQEKTQENSRSISWACKELAKGRRETKSTLENRYIEAKENNLVCLITSIIPNSNQTEVIKGIIEHLEKTSQ
ncbi:MAG: hypothetical protein ACPG05_00085 [Bdellovibrionales bacterium]